MANIPQPESSASFWHSEPSEFLLGHRTTPDLPAEADVVIIGSGITGASVARYLTENARGKDLSVVMLDAREACWGATGRNGGHCQALLLDRGPDVSAFENRNVNTVKAFVEENKVPCEWRSLSSCRAFYTKALAENADKKTQAFKEASADMSKLISYMDDEEELRKHRVGKANGAIITAENASLWPYKLVAFVIERAIKLGRLNLQTKTPVHSIQPCTEEAVNGKLYRQSINTPRGSILARHLVLATNAYTSHLLPEFSDLIVPERGVMSALLPPPNMQRLNNSYGLVGYQGVSPSHDDYLIQRPFANVPNPAGHLMFGGGKAAATLESIGETDDTIVDPGCAGYLKRMLLEAMELTGDTDGLTALEATKIWSGIWGVSKDNRPWVGAVPDRPGVWLSGGYSGEPLLSPLPHIQIYSTGN